MIEVFKKQILRLLSHDDYRAGSSSSLAKHIGVEKCDYEEFEKAVAQLTNEGKIVVGSKAMVTLPAMSNRIRGTFRANPKGFGFVIPSEANAHGDLFIPPENTASAMTGDTVVAKAARRGGAGGRIRGEIVEIVQRANNRFVGVIVKNSGRYFIIPDGKAFSAPIEIGDITAKDGRLGDKAVIEITSFPEKGQAARGVIIEVLGRAGGYEVEIAATISQFSLPGEFDEQCVSQATQAGRNFNPDDCSGRIDLTASTIITIDPPDAKDFDDAISIDKKPDGSFVLGVHIADVSNFVEAGSALDVEAGERGNSVYLPRRTIPMLPEVLSNGICSLQPEQKRFTKTVFITYDSAGKVVSAEFHNAVICSVARLTYLEADKILSGKKSHSNPGVNGLLKDMDTLSRLIEGRRKNAGMLHLDLLETELIFDKAGAVVDATFADDCYPHTIIEMFMVEANEAAARVLRAGAVANMRRIHPDPEVFSLKTLATTLKILGYPVGKNIDRFALQSLLDAVKGSDASFAVNTYVLRSLGRAEYSPLNIGHFALASKDYGHFTSPIRRYADLLVHRLLDLHIAGKLKPNSKNVKTLDELVEIGKHITSTERTAAEAEDDLTKVLILNMLKGRVGDEMDTIVSGMANFGIFLRCRKFGIEGLVPLEMLEGDTFKYDQKAQCVYGVATDATIRVGKQIKARIISVDLPGRQLNLAVAEPLVSASRKKSRNKKRKIVKTKKRKSNKRRGRRR